MTTYDLQIDRYDFKILRSLAMNQNPAEAEITPYQIENFTRFSHDLVWKRVKKLEKNGLILKTSQKKLSTGKNRKTFEISLLGLVNYFKYISDSPKLVSKTEIKKIVHHCQKLLPWISNNWEKLTKLFHEDVLITKLIESSHIFIDNAPGNRISFSVASAPILVRNLKLNVSSGVFYDNTTSLRQMLTSKKMNRNLSKLFNFVFIYKLGQNYFELLNFPSGKKGNDLIQIFKSDQKTCSEFLEILGRVEVDTAVAYDRCNRLKKKIT